MSASYERKRGIQIHREIIYGSHARLLSPAEVALAPAQHSHRWTVFLTSAATPPPKMKRKGKGKGKVAGQEAQVEDEDIDYLPGGADDLSWLIKRVSFKLHDTYAQPLRNVDKPPFQVSETGWGEFVINIKVTFQAETAEKPVNFSHEIKLHHWGPHLDIPMEPSQGLLAAGDDTGIAETPGSALEDGQRQGTTTRANSEAVPAGAVATGEDADEKAGEEKETTKEPEETSGAPEGEEAEEETETKDVEMTAPEGDDEEDAEGEEEEDADGEPDDDVQMEDAEEGAGAGDVVKQEPAETEDQTNGTQEAPQEEPSVTANINPLPVHSWQFDELVFVDPTQQFYDLLIAHPPTPLPARSLRRPQVEGDGAIAGFDRGSAGVPLEFDKEMMVAEAALLDEARRSIVQETDNWRQKLILLEKEQQSLKEDLGMA